VYGPLIQGCTTVLFEGKPVGTPDAATFWRVVEKHAVTNLYTAPTALRAIRKEDPDLRLPNQHDISTLRGIFLAGERADPGTVSAYADALGVDIVDNWWQTETGWPISGMQLEDVGFKAGSCSLPLPGYDVRVLDAETHEEMPVGELGSLAVKLPFPPGVMQTLYNNDQRYVDAYLTEFGDGFYSAGDAGFIDGDGYLSVMARTDDVINTAGHRLSTGQMEEIISTHPRVAECAVIGADDNLKGQVPVGLVVLNAGQESDDEAKVIAEVILRVRESLGPVAAFKSAAVVPGLPKTRSGKILRGVIQKIANGKEYKLPGTIEDVGPVDMAAEALEGLGYPENI
jgi:propionyl-CoA synthetase